MQRMFSRKYHFETPVGPWGLIETFLRPEPDALKSFATCMASCTETVLTFEFPESAECLTFHKSLLTSFEGPLKALVTKPFKESSQDVCNLQERYQDFAIIQKLLYRRCINLAKCSPETVFVLDRWGLREFIRIYQRALMAQHLSLLEFCRQGLASLIYFDADRIVKEYFVQKFATEFEVHNISWFSSEATLIVDGMASLLAKTSTSSSGSSWIRKQRDELVETGNASAKNEEVRVTELGTDWKYYFRANAIWEVLRNLKVLDHAISHVLFSNWRDYSGAIVKSVLTDLSSRLDFEELAEVLEAIPFDAVASHSALEQAASWELSAMALHVISRWEAKPIDGCLKVTVEVRNEFFGEIDIHYDRNAHGSSVLEAFGIGIEFQTAELKFKYAIFYENDLGLLLKCLAKQDCLDGAFLRRTCPEMQLRIIGRQCDECLLAKKGCINLNMPLKTFRGVFSDMNECFKVLT